VKRPNFLWMLFYGRARRGFPWLLALVILAVLLGAASFRVFGGPDMSRAAFPIFVGVLLVAALVFAIVASLRPRKRR
jgi:uncharacterized membrane protein HdeD (DUF308 family)